MATILVAEDDRDFRELLVFTLNQTGYEVDSAEDGLQAVDMIHNRKYDLVLSDVKLPLKDGMEVLQDIMHVSPDTDVIMMTAYGTMDSAALSMKMGAADYLQKPFSIPELEMRVEKALKHRSLTREIAYLRHTQDVIYCIEDIVGQGEGIRNVLKQALTLAGESSPVLIKGESGTGRQLIAGAIHFNSGRKDRGFVKVNCAVTNPYHLESDLFGHVKDAYPGAKAPRTGRIEQANEGTICLEEITEVPMALQNKILNFINTGNFSRLGGQRDVSVDVRIIAITSRDLGKEKEAGHFLPELEAVLSSNVLEIPPLRERKEDIPQLVSYFIERLRLELDERQAKGLSEDALEKLILYDWPGNIREIKNVLERAIFTSDKDILEPADVQLPGEKSEKEAAELTDRKLKELEKEAVVEALEKTNYVQKDAARLLGISKRVIHYKIQQFGIKHPKWIKNR